jgi:hypothetical protein
MPATTAEEFASVTIGSLELMDISHRMFSFKFKPLAAESDGSWRPRRSQRNTQQLATRTPIDPGYLFQA